MEPSLSEHDLARIVLSPEDAAAFCENEEIVRQHLGTFFAVGYALHLISERRWYRAKGYVSFASYCLGEWNMGSAYAYRLMAAAEAVATVAEAEGIEVSPFGDTLPPTVPRSEAVARPLTRLDAADQPMAFAEATRAARAQGLAAPTARHVAAAVAAIAAPAPAMPPQRATTGSSAHTNAAFCRAKSEIFAGAELSEPAHTNAERFVDAPAFAWRALHRLFFEYADSDGEARTLFAEIDQLPPSPDARQKVFRIWIGGERYGAAATLDDAKALIEAQFRSAAGIGGDQ